MKWIETQRKKIVSLSAITEFVADQVVEKRGDGKSDHYWRLRMLIGETEEFGGRYDTKEQANVAYNELLDFLKDGETGGNVFAFPDNDCNFWLKEYDIETFCEEMGIEYWICETLCKRHRVRTVYDIMPTSDGGETAFSPLSKVIQEDLYKKRDKFVAERQTKE